MTYATSDDLTTRFTESELIQLTDRLNVGQIDTDVLDKAIADASAEIDSYLTRYTLPLATVPDVLPRICADIARYYLYDDMAPEHVIRRYDQALSYLKDVAKGVIDLFPPTAGTSTGSVEFQSQPSVFSRDNY